MMKFIIRDDDLNYHFPVEKVKEWYSDIIDICPISICLVPFIKGHHLKWCSIFENHEPYDVQDWLNDNQIFPLGDNKELTSYVKELIAENKASISLHGIHHRNEEGMQAVKNNFIQGAEFYTNNDYSSELKNAVDYVNALFGIKVKSFSPPQNMVNDNGIRAIITNGLSLCTDLISPRFYKECISRYGFLNYIKICKHKIRYNTIYPYVLKHDVKFINHVRLQPGSNIEKILATMDEFYKVDGAFVLSTHSYAFDYKMTNYDMTMKEALIKILDYSRRYESVEYTTLHDLL